MRIFEIVKENVNLREAAELYGIDVNRFPKRKKIRDRNGNAVPVPLTYFIFNLET